MTTSPRSRPFSVIGRVVIASLLAAAMMLGQSRGMDTAGSDGRQTQRGFAPIWDVSYDGPQQAQSVREMVEVGATWVQFTTRNASAIARTPRTVGDDSLEGTIALDHRYRVKVFLTPHLESPIPKLESCSIIRPDDCRAWFASYTASISYYAAMAAARGRAVGRGQQILLDHRRSTPGCRESGNGGKSDADADRLRNHLSEKPNNAEEACR